MRPGFLAFAVVLAAFLAARRRKLGRETLIGGALAVAGAAAIGSGLVELPDFAKLIEDVGKALGKWTYLLVGLLAYLETGAFIGLVAPGETAVLVGGVVAAQGEIDLMVLIALVWACAVAGDLTSYMLGRRLGRAFLVRHGPKLRITEDRLEKVEEFFDRHGGPTILIGRFIGLVRSLAPFVAGASRMPLRRFLPYDVIGSGLWSATFCVLGYIFWHSLDRVTQYVGRGIFLLSLLVALGVAIHYGRRMARDPQFKAQVEAWLGEQAQRPLLRPLARVAIPAYRRFGRPLARRLAGPARFVGQRLTPGELGLELTTLLALAVVGGYVFFFLGALISDARPLLPLDAETLELADKLRSPLAIDLVEALTWLGSLPAVAVATLATAIWCARRRRTIDALTLAGSLFTLWVAVDLAKEAEGRERPLDSLVATDGLSYPSGHAAYGVAYIACAVVLVRAGSSLAVRFAAVTVAVMLCAAIALSRVYLRSHYLSDVVGGVALGVAIFALGGIIGLVVAYSRHNEES